MKKKSSNGFCNYCGEKLIQEDRFGGICGSCDDLDKDKAPKDEDEPEDDKYDTEVPGQMWTDDFW